jgi:hypothetical protein
LETTELKLFTEQEKYRVDIYQQANEVIKDFEVNVQNKKEIRFDINILLKLEIDNEPCLLIVGIDITERKKATEDFKSKQSANKFQCNVKKIRTIFSQI